MHYWLGANGWGTWPAPTFSLCASIVTRFQCHGHLPLGKGLADPHPHLDRPDTSGRPKVWMRMRADANEGTFIAAEHPSQLQLGLPVEQESEWAGGW